jgi:hypothetical protein
MKTISEYKERKLAIRLALATMRHNFFANGVESPMRERTALELELAQIEHDLASIDKAAATARFALKTRHYQIVRERLTELGHPSLWDDCYQLAIKETS